LHIKIDKPTSATDVREQGNTFFDAMILPDDHDQLLVPAGPQANFALEDAFLTALATGISVM
jgi:hypothetical protein